MKSHATIVGAAPASTPVVSSTTTRRETLSDLFGPRIKNSDETMVLRQAILHEASKAQPSRPHHYCAPLKLESRNCLKRLASYNSRGKNPYTSGRYPLARLSAVLVPLFIGRWGDLYVLLSRRASSMRSYAGDTALPGGRREDGDRSPEDTARREAFEEIGLPKDRVRIPLLCTLEPFLSTNNLIVFPVVVLITDPSIKPVLESAEVSALFSHPLLSLLSTSSPVPLTTLPPPKLPTSSSASESWTATPESYDSPTPEYHTYKDITWGPPGSLIRIHRFLMGREPDVKPLFGMTAAILLRVAIVGYHPDFLPQFDVEAPNQIPMMERLYWAMTHETPLVEACKKEGITPKLAKLPDMPGAEKKRKRDDTKVKSRL